MRAPLPHLSLTVVLGAAALMPVAASAAVKADRVVPRAAVPGAALELRGSGLAARATRVTVGGRRAKVLSRGARRLRFVVPRVRPGARTVAVRRGRRSDTAPMRVLKPFRGRVGLRVDRRRARTRTVGPAGGTVSARGRDGTRYALAVPAGALATERAITVTPARGFSGLPLTGGGARGVQLAPDGLRFATPATMTIRSRRAFPGKSLGFSSATGFAVTRASGSGRTRTIEVEHFSGAGAAGATRADFANAVGPLVSGLGRLTESQIEELISLVDRWEALFPPNFCATQPVCGVAVDKALGSIELLVRARCDAGFGDPSLTVLRDMVRLEGLRRVLGGSSDSSDECRDGIAVRVANRSLAAVCGPGAGPLARYAAVDDLPPAERPGGSLDADGEITQLEFLLFLIGPLSAEGLDATAGQVRDCGMGALEGLPAAGRARCDADPAAAERDLRRALAYAETLHQVLQPFIDALDFCRIALSVVPGTASLDPGVTERFAAAVTGILDTSNADVTWTASGGAIDAGGVYTAPTAAGDYTVTATSVLNPARTATASVTVGSCPGLDARAAGNGRIAFNMGVPVPPFGGWEWDVYSMSAGGGDIRNLTNFAPDVRFASFTADEAPAWSPDGTRIAFQSSRDGEGLGNAWNTEIYVMDADGGHLTNLSNTRAPYPAAEGRNQYPAWSPDGSRIAFHRWHGFNVEDPDAGLWIMDADGSDLTQILSTSFAADVAWSPDGTRIAYDLLLLSPTSREVLRTVRPDGTGDVPLNVDGAFPEWSPDGTRVAYLHGRDLWVAKADGSGDKEQLTFSETVRGQGRFAWSPDGTRIAYSAGLPSTAFDIWTVEVATGDTVKLTSFTHRNLENVTWQAVPC